MDSPIYEQPVRGTYPHPAVIGLPGRERTGVGDDPKIPRPPIHHLFGMRPAFEGATGPVFTMPASPWLQTHAGVFLAGATALVADAPLGSAIIREMPAGSFGTTSQLSMSFQRPAGVESKELLARASAVDVGKTVGLSEVIVEDAHGRLLALMTSRYYLMHFDQRPEPPERWIADPVDHDTPDPYLRPLPPDLQPEAHWEMSGLEFFEALRDGKLPPSPAGHLFGIREREVGEGRVVSTTIASEWFCSPARTIYGGVLAYLADAAMTGAAATTVPAGSTCATLDLTLHFLRPVLPTNEELTLIGEVIHRGKRLIVARAEIRNAAGKPVVIGNGSLRVLEGRIWTPELSLDAGGAED